MGLLDECAHFVRLEDENTDRQNERIESDDFAYPCSPDHVLWGFLNSASGGIRCPRHFKIA